MKYHEYDNLDKYKKMKVDKLTARYEIYDIKK